MSVDSKSPKDLESSPSTKAIVNDRTRQSMPSLERLEEIVEKTEICILEERFDEAKRFVKEQYVILEVLQRRKGNSQEPQLAAKFFRCAHYLNAVSVFYVFNQETIISYRYISCTGPKPAEFMRYRVVRTSVRLLRLFS